MTSIAALSRKFLSYTRSEGFGSALKQTLRWLYWNSHLYHLSTRHVADLVPASLRGRLPRVGPEKLYANHWNSLYEKNPNPWADKDAVLRAAKLRLMVKYGFEMDMDLLDVGCGPGMVARVLEESGRFRGCYVGVDISDVIIRQCEREFEAPDFVFCVTRDNRLSCIESSSFDLVVVFSVFTHMMNRDIKEMLHAIHRVMRPGAMAICSIIEGEGDSQQSISQQVGRKEMPVQEFLALAQDAAFEVVNSLSGEKLEHPEAFQLHFVLKKLKAR